jgi:hypothetical protein
MRVRMLTEWPKVVDCEGTDSVYPPACSASVAGSVDEITKVTNRIAHLISGHHSAIAVLFERDRHGVTPWKSSAFMRTLIRVEFNDLGFFYCILTIETSLCLRELLLQIGFRDAIGRFIGFDEMINQLSFGHGSLPLA